jgi:hypothetical protein
MPIYSEVAAAAHVYSYASQGHWTEATSRRRSDFAFPLWLAHARGNQVPPLRHPEDELLTHSIDLASRARCIFAIIPSK